MDNKKTKTALLIIGGLVGITFTSILLNTYVILNYNILTKVLIYIGCSLIGAILFCICGVKFAFVFHKFFLYIETKLKSTSSYEILFVSLGLIIGLIIANLISQPIMKLPTIGIMLSIIINIVLACTGVYIAISKSKDMSKNALFPANLSFKTKKSIIQPKILDTSVIIDGRISDICRVGFIEGPIIIPIFILVELQHIADSSDALKRNRGRRGLDILNIIQKETNIQVEILDKDFEDVSEVDSKLVKLAEHIGGKIITNDYNLNKVAKFQGVSVLNINELANAVKPVVLPGEAMKVHVLKDGKENGQGIAYLDDGTMIVIEGGKKHMGSSLEVLVTSVLQTPAGRMIFARPRYGIERVV